jgi:fucose permease
MLRTPARTPTSVIRRSPPLGVLLLIYAAFISLGLPDGILGAAWPQMRAGFGVALNGNWPMLALGMAGGMVSSFFSGLILRRLGVGRVLILTTILTASVILGYACSPGFAGIVVLSFFLGLGNGAVDAGLNNFVASNLSSRHMNWLHAFWGVGVSLGTLIISVVFAFGGTWRIAYLIIGPVQLALGVAFVLHLPSLQRTSTTTRESPRIEQPAFLSTFRLPSAWASMALFFAYSGLEFGTGVWIASFLHDGRGWAMQSAGLMVSLYWGSMMVGRFLIGTISHRTTPLRIVRGATLGVVAGTGLIAVSSLMVGWPQGAGWVTAGGLLVTGLSLAPIFPMLMHDTPRCVGPGHAANLIGIQSALANLGMTVLPALLGTIMRFGGTEWLGPMLAGLALTQVSLLAVRERFTGVPDTGPGRPPVNAN